MIVFLFMCVCHTRVSGKSSQYKTLNILGIVHCTYLVVSGYNLFYCISLSDDLFYHYKQCRP